MRCLRRGAPLRLERSTRRFCLRRARAEAPRHGEHLFGEVAHPRARERLAEEGDEPQPGARGARHICPLRVELGTRADVHVVVAHALVDVATVLGLGGDLGVDALLEPEEAPPAPAPVPEPSPQPRGTA